MVYLPNLPTFTKLYHENPTIHAGKSTSSMAGIAEKPSSTASPEISQGRPPQAQGQPANPSRPLKLWPFHVHIWLQHTLEHLKIGPNKKTKSQDPSKDLKGCNVGLYQL